MSLTMLGLTVMWYSIGEHWSLIGTSAQGVAPKACAQGLSQTTPGATQTRKSWPGMVSILHCFGDKIGMFEARYPGRLLLGLVNQLRLRGRGQGMYSTSRSTACRGSWCTALCCRSCLDWRYTAGTKISHCLWSRSQEGLRRCPQQA